MDNDAIIESILTVEEGFKALVYDDATGKLVVPGYTLIGNPTIGYGWAVNKSPMSKDEALLVLRNRYSDAASNLSIALEWFATLSPVRRAVLVVMAYQMGTAGLLGFHNTLHACQVGDWTTASQLMLESAWAKQTPARALRMSKMMQTGNLVQ